MAIHDFKSQRLYLDVDLVQGSTIECTREQANYLVNVLRLGSESNLLIFNGRDGEWLARLELLGRKKCTLTPIEKVREQTEASDLTYCFAPLKQARLDYMIQKAVEMGVGTFQPVLTQYTQVRSVNEKRMMANAIEAAEQCGLINLPTVAEPKKLSELSKILDEETLIVFCDEAKAGERGLDCALPSEISRVALLIGPEGGFSDEERELISTLPNVRYLGLGPRILRADTAAVAALAIIQSRLGDWYS